MPWLAANRLNTTPESHRVFCNVCDQLDRDSRWAGWDPAGAAVISRLATPSLTEVYEQIWQGMVAYLARYETSSRLEQKKDHVERFYRRMTRRVNALVSAGEVEPRTAIVFLQAFRSLGDIGAYQAIVRNHELLTPEELSVRNQDYVHVVRAMWARQPVDARRQSAGFCHFNPQSGRRIKSRIYVSARLSGAPAIVVAAWYIALHETGCRGRVYFKVPAALTRRFETIVCFQTHESDDAMTATLLAAFAQTCPANLLNSRDMPTGVPLARGISLAPEPTEINTLNRYTGSRERLSYNQLIAAIAELAFELAYADTQARGVANPTPRSSREAAGEYFQQLIRLSAINPQTMQPDS